MNIKIFTSLLLFPSLLLAAEKKRTSSVRLSLKEAKQKVRDQNTNTNFPFMMTKNELKEKMESEKEALEKILRKKSQKSQKDVDQESQKDVNQKKSQIKTYEILLENIKSSQKIENFLKKNYKKAMSQMDKKECIFPDYTPFYRAGLGGNILAHAACSKIATLKHGSLQTLVGCLPSTNISIKDALNIFPNNKRVRGTPKHFDANPIFNEHFKSFSFSFFDYKKNGSAISMLYQNKNLKNKNLKNENLKNENLKNENLKNENLNSVLIKRACEHYKCTKDETNKIVNAFNDTEKELEDGGLIHILLPNKIVNSVGYLSTRGGFFPGRATVFPDCIASDQGKNRPTSMSLSQFTRLWKENILETISNQDKNSYKRILHIFSLEKNRYGRGFKLIVDGLNNAEVRLLVSSPLLQSYAKTQFLFSGNDQKKVNECLGNIKHILQPTFTKNVSPETILEI
jgi:hypothetical protein